MPNTQSAGPSTSIAVLESKVDTLLEDGASQREQLREISKAVQKLAVIEERQSADRAAQERAFASIAKVETRLTKLEESDPINKLTSGAVAKVIGLTLAAIVGANLSGLLGGRNQPPAMIQVGPSAPPIQQLQPPKAGN